MGSCRISEAVTALQFVSRTVLACCHFSTKSKKAANFRRLRALVESGSNAFVNKKEKGTIESPNNNNNAPESVKGSRRWIYTEVASAREAEALPDHLLSDDGSFCLSFIDVSTGQEIASLGGLPFRENAHLRIIIIL